MMSGLAVLDATEKLKTRIEAVADDLGIPREETGARLPEIAEAFWLGNLDPAVEGWAETQPVSWDSKTGLGDVYPVYAYATHVAEVEIDAKTGEAHVVDFVAVHDSGTVLNRTLAVGQVQGGVAQGIGFALMEEIPQRDGRLVVKVVAQGIGFALMEEIPQRDGRLVVNGLTTYRIPTVRDVADETKVDFVEAAFPSGPYGAKGIGEVPLMASHAAVARAVAHATGQQPTSYPLSPASVRDLIQADSEPAE
jgi:CO/xanthine dehydrogenase Mo-binding subunit